MTGLVALTTFFWFAAPVAPTAAFAGGGPIADGLVRASDLPGMCVPFTPAAPTEGGHDLCGEPLTGTQQSIDEASIAWAMTPGDGPIFGERIERFQGVKPARQAIAYGEQLRTPCRFTDQQG